MSDSLLFAVGKVTLAQILVPVLRPSLVIIIPPVLRTHFLVELLFAEGQAGKAWEPSKSNALSEICEL